MGGGGSKVEPSETKGEKDDKYGKPYEYDASFKGPIQNRSCTDVICCLLFIICILGMGVCGYFAFTRGDPTKLLYPTDSQGNICGVGAYADKPNLFFFDLLACGKMGAAVIVNGCPTPQVCVKECPSSYWAWATLYTKELVSGPSPDRSQMFCKYTVDPTTSSKSVKQLVEDEDCAAYYVPSSPIVGRCIPSIFSTILNKTVGLVTSDNATVTDRLNNTITGTGLEEGSRFLALFLSAKEYGMQVLQDVRSSWWLILVGLGIAMIIAFIWIIIMRWVAGPMVFITIVCFIGLFGFGTYYSFTKWLAMKDDPAAQGNFEFTTNLSYYTSLANTWLALGIISAVFLGLILLILLFLRQRIMIAIALIKESSRAIGSMIFTLLWPIIPFILEIILFGYWIAVAIFLASSGTADFSATNKTVNFTNVSGVQEVVENYIDSLPCDPTENSTLGSICEFVKYGNDEYTIYLQVFMLFMLFWVMNFIVALGQMTLAGAFASFYWVFDKSDIPLFPVSASLWRCFRYHLGTLAFGSLIIAIIQIIRVALEYIDHKLKGSENQVAKFFLKCMKCCFWCLEKFMKFLNKNAYIITAVYGKNFCMAAKDAFMLIMRNIVRVAVVDKVTDFLLFIGKLVVTAAVGELSDQVKT